MRIVLICFALFSCGPRAVTLAYDDHFGDETTLDFFASKKPLAPLIVLVHGGGWREGSKSQMASLAQVLSSKGYAVAATNYRLGPGGVYPHAPQDVLCSLAFLSENSQTYDFDRTRVALIGYSAGGHLASLLALDSEIKNESCRYKNSLSLRAVITGAAPQNLTTLSWANDVQKFLGTTVQQDPAIYARASPIRHVGPKAPPFLLVHGDQDLYVPIEQSIQMKLALSQNGTFAQLLSVQGGGHVLNPASTNDTISADLTLFDIPEVQQVMVHFLAEHL
jgi:acetyl esterase/lipase